MISIFLQILRRVFCHEDEAGLETRHEYFRPNEEAPPSSRRSFSPPHSYSTPISTDQPRYTSHANYRAPTTPPVIPVGDEPACKTTPIRSATTQTTPSPSVSQRNYVPSVRHPTVSSSESFKKTIPSAAMQTPSPSVPQRNSVASVRPPTVSMPSPKPSGLSPPSESFKQTIRSTATQTPSPSVPQRNYVASVLPPSVSIPSPKPSGLSSSESAKKTIISPSFWDLYGFDDDPDLKQPDNHASCHGSDPPKKPSNRRRPGGGLPVFQIPADIKYVIERDIVPEVLKRGLSPANYADYFAALLYAEDYYMEKWSEFLKSFILPGVTLRLRDEETKSEKWRKSNNNTGYMGRQRSRSLESSKGGNKVYVEFDIDSMPEKRPYLLSKDYVYVRRSGEAVKPFQGFVSRVEKSKLLLAEFGDDFHAQHSSTQKYDVWFDFNRVCLKRSHQGVAAAIDPSFQGILFPEPFISRSIRHIPTFPVPFNRNLVEEEMSAVKQILSLKGPPPYLIVQSSSMRIQEVIIEAILQIYRTFGNSRILIVAPQNRTCDSLMIHLKKEIPDSEMFRANAAFRELDEVPTDILSSTLYKGECFACPPFEDLRKFRVTASTFMSSFRLHHRGICAGHFSHIFVVDACYATEPETMVTLANLADESTAVVLTGSYQHYAKWVRSDIITRANGLRRSYFKRLLESEPYLSRDPGFVKYL